jgi:polyisoprenoid-binding protein YceI
MKKLIFTFFAVLLLAPIHVQAQELVAADQVPAGSYALDPTHASLTWKVMHLGLANYTARFTKFDAQLEYDPAQPENSRLSVSVDPMSIRTDYPNKSEKDFDTELGTSEKWFNAGKFPHIKFVSNKIERTGDKTGKVHGTLTLLGVSKPLTLDVTFNGAYTKKPFAEVPALGFSGHAVLKRSHWGLNTYVPMVGDEVELLIEVEFHKS